MKHTRMTVNEADETGEKGKGIKMKRINWSKIDVITYNLKDMTEESKAEVEKANAILTECEYRGDYSKAAYIRRRLNEKRNFIMC